ncbi:hypothetical protein LTR53_001173 [Teratosphaeriaceae sp. CCFEE 6253]|nr:hypothetical protein LTR53_001173 [Teratosphaeriaceae sp. CCFEE 6253]
MADSISSPAVPPPNRPSRPMSEALLNEKWDHCLSTMLIRSTIGAGFGVIFSVLLFKRRAFPVWLGTGFGAGRAWEECDSMIQFYTPKTSFIVLETYISFLAWKMERLDAQTSIVKRPVIEVPEDEDSMAAAVFDSNDPSSPLHYTAQQTALLLLDFQGFIISQCGDVGPAALAVAVQMRDWACEQDVTVVHSVVDVTAQVPPCTKGAVRLTTLLSTLRDDRDAVEKPAELAFAQRNGEYIVLKPPGVISGLKSQGAMDLLAQHDIKSLIICGLSTSGAVLRTATAATDEGFVASVVSDACADPKEGMHEIVLGTILPNRAHVMDAVELMAQWEKAMATSRSAGPGKADD